MDKPNLPSLHLPTHLLSVGRGLCVLASQNTEWRCPFHLPWEASPLAATKPVFTCGLKTLTAALPCHELSSLHPYQGVKQPVCSSATAFIKTKSNDYSNYRGSRLGLCHIFLLTSLVDCGQSLDPLCLGIALLAGCHAFPSQWVTTSISFYNKKYIK